MVVSWQEKQWRITSTCWILVFKVKNVDLKTFYTRRLCAYLKSLMILPRRSDVSWVPFWCYAIPLVICIPLHSHIVLHEAGRDVQGFPVRTYCKLSVSWCSPFSHWINFRPVPQGFVTTKEFISLTSLEDGFRLYHIESTLALHCWAVPQGFITIMNFTTNVSLFSHFSIFLWLQNSSCSLGYG